MNEVDRRSALACLAAVELNLAELRGMPSWWSLIARTNRFEFQAFEDRVRAYQHALQNLPMALDEAVDADGG